MFAVVDPVPEQGSGKVVFQQVSSSVIGRCGLRL